MQGSIKSSNSILHLQGVQYRAETLDALAILLTAVKVLYLGGAISRAAVLVEMIEPARLASSKPLHTTLIRNEAAYFSCVAQLLRHFPPPPTPCNIKPIFLCGDSHTLSGETSLSKPSRAIKFLILPVSNAAFMSPGAHSLARSDAVTFSDPWQKNALRALKACHNACHSRHTLGTTWLLHHSGGGNPL